MKILTISIVVGIGLLVAISGYSVETPSSLSVYQRERDALNAQDAFSLARKTVEQSGEEEVIQEAVLDLVKYSADEENNRLSLEQIEGALDKLPSDCPAFRESTLAKGKLLARLGKRDDADILFQKAIKKHWKNAVWRYSESFIENGALDQACILEFLRISGLPPYVYYRGTEESLDIFLRLLLMFKIDQSYMSSMDQVYQPILKEIREEDPYAEIAKALCQAIDGQSEKSIETLKSIDTRLELSRFRIPPRHFLRKVRWDHHREYFHIPVYLATLSLRNGDYLEAMKAFDLFMERNQGKNKKIVDAAIRILWDMIIEKGLQRHKDEFASFLLDNAWFKDRKVKEEIGIENIAILYDQQQSGLAWSEKWDESVAICKFVMENYPDTLGGQNCFHCYALYIGWHNQNEAESIRFFQRILENPKSDTLAANARVILAEIAMKKGNWQEALAHIQDALNRTSPYEKGWKTERRKHMVDLKEKIDRQIQSQ